MANIKILGRAVDGDSPYQEINADDVILNPSAINGGITSVTANYTVLTSDGVVLVDTTSGAVTVTLPAPSFVGEAYTIKRISATANNATIATADSATIDGAATDTLAAQWAFVKVVSDGTDWFIVATG